MKKFILVVFALTILSNAYAENEGVSNCAATLDGDERQAKIVNQEELLNPTQSTGVAQE